MRTSAKRQAISDMLSELQHEGKHLIQFRKNLNPIMRILVKEYLKKQSQLNKLKNNIMYNIPTKANSQLIAHCTFFSKGSVKLDNYTEYYKEDHEEQ